MNYLKVKEYNNEFEKYELDFPKASILRLVEYIQQYGFKFVTGLVAEKVLEPYRSIIEGRLAER